MTGGTAAIAERIIKSRQMKEAKKALESDQTCTKHLQDQLTEVMTNEKVKRKIGKDLVITYMWFSCQRIPAVIKIISGFLKWSHKPRSSNNSRNLWR